MELQLLLGLAPYAAILAVQAVTLVVLFWVHASLAKRLDQLQQRRREGPRAPAVPPTRPG